MVVSITGLNGTGQQFETVTELNGAMTALASQIAEGRRVSLARDPLNGNSWMLQESFNITRLISSTGIPVGIFTCGLHAEHTLVTEEDFSTITLQNPTLTRLMHRQQIAHRDAQEQLNRAAGKLSHDAFAKFSTCIEECRILHPEAIEKVAYAALTLSDTQFQTFHQFIKQHHIKDPLFIEDIAEKLSSQRGTLLATFPLEHTIPFGERACQVSLSDEHLTLKLSTPTKETATDYYAQRQTKRENIQLRQQLSIALFEDSFIEQASGPLGNGTTCQLTEHGALEITLQHHGSLVRAQELLHVMQEYIEALHGREPEANARGR